LHWSIAMGRLCAVIAAVSIASGCSPSPQKAATDAREAAGSWGATLSAAAERWGSGQISTRYFQSLVTQARRALRQESHAAREAAGEPAARPVDAVASHIEAMSDAATRGDHAAAIDAGHAAASEAPAEPTPPVARPR
jgi:hypothetical protein